MWTKWPPVGIFTKRIWQPYPHYAPPPCIHKLQSCISTAPLPKAISWAYFASTSKHYDKTVVLWHAITRGSDIVTRTLACRICVPSFFSSYKKRLSQSVLLHFRQEDISQNLAETSLSPWPWEFNCYANNLCWGRTDLQIT